MGRKKIIFPIFFLFCIIPLHARLKFVGPNPCFSFLHFPQDSRFFPTGTSFFLLSYRNPGWMGNLDDPFQSPSALYINTEEKVQESFNGKSAEAGFKGSWFNAEFISAPFVYDFKGLKIIPMFTLHFDSFSLKAEGDAIAHSYEGNYWLIPFSSRVSQKNYGGNIGLVLTSLIKNLPAGLILNYYRGAEDSPKGFLQFTQDGRTNRFNRYTWGWSASSGCQKIFGTSTNIDAFWQDSYTDTRRDQIDLVFGMDLNENKFGFRYRNININGDYYSYSRALDKYIRDERSEKTTINVFRPYSVLKISNLGKGKLFTVSVLEIDLLKERPVSKGKEFVNSYDEKKLTGEVLPFIHFDLQKGFIRFGSGLSFGYKWYSYTDIWGKQKVYQPSTPYFDWEMSWERSSYGNEISLINFTDMNLEIILEDRINSTFRLEIFRILTYYRTKRFYGKNIYDGESFNFLKTAERLNTLKEDWLGGTIGFLFGKKILMGVFMDLPVFYKKSISTDIRGKQKEFFEGFRDFQPAVREPLRFWVMIVKR